MYKKGLFPYHCNYSCKMVRSYGSLEQFMIKCFCKFNKFGKYCLNQRFIYECDKLHMMVL